VAYSLQVYQRLVVLYKESLLDRTKRACLIDARACDLKTSCHVPVTPILNSTLLGLGMRIYDGQGRVLKSWCHPHTPKALRTNDEFKCNACGLYCWSSCEIYGTREDTRLRLVYLHKFRISHRDIDIDRNVSLKIIDFHVFIERRMRPSMRTRWSRAGQCETKGWTQYRGGEVNVQPDQGRSVVNRTSSSLSSGQAQERRHGSSSDSEEGLAISVGEAPEGKEAGNFSARQPTKQKSSNNFIVRLGPSV
jgi:hypothetical protein